MIIYYNYTLEVNVRRYKFDRCFQNNVKILKKSFSMTHTYLVPSFLRKICTMTYIIEDVVVSGIGFESELHVFNNPFLTNHYHNP
jgi:hypothetical protein